MFINNISRLDDNLVEAARVFAVEAHGNQMYGELPYTHHLGQVVDILLEYGFTQPELLASAWLHDVLEDTKRTLEGFPEAVQGIVGAVTCKEGRNRKERFRLAYPKIKANGKAIIVKLADRLANVRSSAASNSSLFQMYKKEYPEFRLMLYIASPDTDPMWAELDALLT